jgi:hypothetical protein
MDDSPFWGIKGLQAGAPAGFLNFGGYPLGHLLERSMAAISIAFNIHDDPFGGLFARCTVMHHATYEVLQRLQVAPVAAYQQGGIGGLHAETDQTFFSGLPGNLGLDSHPLDDFREQGCGFMVVVGGVPFCRHTHPDIPRTQSE